MKFEGYQNHFTGNWPRKVKKQKIQNMQISKMTFKIMKISKSVIYLNAIIYMCKT